MTRTIDGIGVTPRTGHGTVHWYRPDRGDEHDLSEGSGTVDEEMARFEEARETAEQELRAERERAAETIGESEAEIFDAHIQFLNDPQIVDSVTGRIADGDAAPVAVRDGFAEPIDRLEHTEGIMAERGDDLRDIRDRLIRILTGTAHPDLSDLPDGAVIFAERLTPSDTAQLDADHVAGFVTVTGGKTSHAAILARSLGIPAVVGAGEELTAVADGAEVVVDGAHGHVIVDPSAEQVASAQEADAVEPITERVATRDGHDVEVAANVGGAAEVKTAVEQGADGIGLFRTEFLYLDRAAPPDEEEQYDVFVEALEAFPDDRVVVRTIDIGGDKPIPYLDLPREENPFLGNRGIRFALGDGAELFRTQLRALLRAAATAHGDNLHVMFPLVATVDEVERARAVVDEVAADLADEGVDHAVPALGVMVETPAAVFTARELARAVDFLSVGTNDLIQYIMAASRGNETVADLHDPLEPAVLRAIHEVVTAGHAEDVWVGMCGEMAGDPTLTDLLVGLGLDELSMSPYTAPRVKANIRDMSFPEASDVAERVLDADRKEAVERIVKGE